MNLDNSGCQRNQRSRISKTITIRSTPIVRKTPPDFMSARFMARNSFRKSFFSEEESPDLSIFLISFSLKSNAFVAGAGEVAFTIPGPSALIAKAD